MGVKAEGTPRVCHREHDEKKRPHPWDTHRQFSIKTLLSKPKKKQGSNTFPNVLLRKCLKRDQRFARSRQAKLVGSLCLDLSQPSAAVSSALFQAREFFFLEKKPKKIVGKNSRKKFI